MRKRPKKAKLSVVILAAIAAGSVTLPAVAAMFGQSSATSTQKSSTVSSTKKSTGRKSATKKKGKKVKGQAAPTSERITEIQEALAKKGAGDLTPTGKWDDSTADAVRKFQASNGLNATGKLDALTLQKLGLGSETAGMAAPTAPPNSVNRLRNTASTPIDPKDDSEPHN